MADTLNSFQSTVRDKVMGAVVLLALLSLVYMSIYGSVFHGVGETPNLYHTRLKESYGISTGGIITLSGLRVGTVDSLELQSDGQVLVALYLDPQHSHFYREGSKVVIDSQLALGSVISGQGLIFQPGEDGAELLPKGSWIPADEPQSLEELMQEWNVYELAETLQQMAQDMSEVVGAINQNQDQLIAAMTHSAEVSANMAAATGEIPAMVGEINQLLETVNETINRLGNDASKVTGDLAEVMVNTRDLTASLEVLAASMAPTAEKSPILMDNLIQVSRETEVLLNKLSQHWLLGGSDVPRVPEQRLDLQGDDTLYQN